MSLIKRLFRFFVIFYAIFFLVYMFYKYINRPSKSLEYKRDESIGMFQNNENQQLNNFDYRCDYFGEWEPIGKITGNTSQAPRTYYFKREAAFYFLDGSFFRLHFLSFGFQYVPLILLLDIKLNDQLVFRQYKLTLNTITSPWTVSTYSFNFMDVPFNLKELMIKENKWPDANLSVSEFLNNNKLEIDINISDAESTIRNLFYSLKAKTKLLKSPFESKKSSLVCVKCLVLDRDSAVKSINWWIKINKLIGYDRIELCNQQISDGVMQILQENADFVGISSLKCIPNMYPTDQFNPNPKWKYFKSFNQLVNPSGEFDVYRGDVINQMFLNECYLKNIDKYQHVTVIDTDETICKIIYSFKILIKSFFLQAKN
jgi:hypothetical protein